MIIKEKHGGKKQMEHDFFTWYDFHDMNKNEFESNIIKLHENSENMVNPDSITKTQFLYLSIKFGAV